VQELQPTDFASFKLARYASEAPIDVSSPALRDAALKCVLDLLGAAIAGADSGVAAGSRRLAKSQFGSGHSSIWFTGELAGRTGAILANATAASVLDLDDGHRAARGHPGAAVIPAALAAAEDLGAGAIDLLESIVVGYEVAVRVAAASAPARKGYGYGSGRWTGYGVVAALGRLLKLPAAQVSQAFAISGVLSPNLTANGSAGYSDLMGNDVKEAIPWSAVTASAAIELAQAGLTGPEDLLDHAPHYSRDVILRDLGSSSAIKGVYFKPYSSCRYVHPALAAFETLVRENKIAPEEVQAVQVHTFQWALDIDNRTEPRNLTEVQYSIPYCIALSALVGGNCMLPITDNVLGRPDVSDFARKVQLVLDPQLEQRCPGETLARVVIEARGQKFESPITAPRGEATNPMSWDDICEKFFVATAAVMREPQQRRVVRDVEDLSAGDLAPLLAALRQPLER
jgi:2-methylcitrate dehydratase PrpD